MPARPRLLLVPLITELEWVIKPQLEEWAEVATFDVPGVGDEPPVEPLDRQAIIDRALAELDRRGWDSYFLVCDGSAIPVGVQVAHARPEAVKGNLPDSEPFERLIREVDVPLLFAKHEGCLANTEEGFEDAVVASPQARTVSGPESPSVSPEYADALRKFCLALSEPATRTAG